MRFKDSSERMDLALRLAPPLKYLGWSLTWFGFFMTSKVQNKMFFIQV